MKTAQLFSLGRLLIHFVAAVLLLFLYCVYGNQKHSDSVILFALASVLNAALCFHWEYHKGSDEIFAVDGNFLLLLLSAFLSGMVGFSYMLTMIDTPLDGALVIGAALSLITMGICYPRLLNVH